VILLFPGLCGFNICILFGFAHCLEFSAMMQWSIHVLLSDVWGGVCELEIGSPRQWASAARLSNHSTTQNYNWRKLSESKLTSHTTVCVLPVRLNAVNVTGRWNVGSGSCNFDRESVHQMVWRHCEDPDDFMLTVAAAGVRGSLIWLLVRCRQDFVGTYIWGLDPREAVVELVEGECDWVRQWQMAVSRP
jgi:hypothetical protein